MAVHICTGPPMTEIRREPDGERWCFQCRQRRQFDYVVLDYIEPSYWDPIRFFECSQCHGHDTDLFPGRFREWVA